MKTPRQNLPTMLLAACIALPFAVQAESVAVDGPHPPEARWQGHDAPEPRHFNREHGFGPQAGPHPGVGGGLHRAPPFLRGLDLSEAQQDKVFAILHAEVPSTRQQGKALDTARQALHALGNSAAYDDAKAVALAQAMAQAVSNLELQRVRTGQKLLAVLTAEQRKQVEQRMASSSVSRAPVRP